MADAANIALPAGFVTDGVSLMPQLLGKNYTPRDWLFAHNEPKKGDFPSARFVHNKEWKLYETGEIYNVIKDPLEKNKIGRGRQDHPTGNRFAFRSIGRPVIGQAR